MQPFEATSAHVEVNGETVLAVVAGMGALSSRAVRILELHGMAKPQPGTWYKQQSWLNAFKDIARTLGPTTLFRIGLQIPERAQFPPDLTTLEQGLEAIDGAYRMNHRGGDIGSYAFQSTGPRSATLVCRNPYPSEFDHGIITAMANRYRSETCAPEVKLDPTQPSRLSGGDSCTFLVTW
jgi:hypothetical protein